MLRWTVGQGPSLLSTWASLQGAGASLQFECWVVIGSIHSTRQRKLQITYWLGSEMCPASHLLYFICQAVTDSHSDSEEGTQTPSFDKTVKIFGYF